MIHRYVLGFLLLAGILLSACGRSQGPNPAAGPAKVEDPASLMEALKAAGKTVELHDPIRQPFFTPEGRLVGLGNTDLQVFEYPSAAEMEKEAAQVAPDGGSVGSSMINWVEPPHFFKTGRIIILYLGSDPAVLEALQKVLGPQFAGR
ncbi:MAG: hypothetical protein ACM3QS_14410 [Bacteroidota bacterium]